MTEVVKKQINQEGEKLLFLDAHTHSAWLDQPVDNALLEKAYSLAKMAPTSANCSPMRLVFVCSPEAKERLKPCLAEGNVEKTMTAPVTAIVGQDMRFYEQLPRLFPHADARSWFEGNEELIAETAFRNATLQGAYFLLALRSQGLDCGPMSGFDKKKVDEIFFAKTSYHSNFLINIGYGDPKALFPRAPRLDVEEACRFL